MKRYDHVIFDFDGTIADSAPGVTASIKYALETAGIDAGELSELKKYVGPPLKRTFSENFGLRGEALERVMKAFRDRYDKKDMYNTSLFPGIEEMMKSLCERGVKLSVASSKSESMVVAICEYLKIDGYFEIIVGVKDPMDYSTKTENIQKTMRAVGVSAERTVMVGDRCFDAKGAAEAEIDFIAALYSDMAPKEEFDDFKTVLFATTTARLADYILGQ